MKASRLFAIVFVVALAIAVGITVAGAPHSFTKAGVPATVVVGTHVTASGETIPTVTVVAQRPSSSEKWQAALRNAAAALFRA